MRNEPLKQYVGRCGELARIERWAKRDQPMNFQLPQCQQDLSQADTWPC